MWHAHQLNVPSLWVVYKHNRLHGLFAVDDFGNMFAIHHKKLAVSLGD